MQPGTPASILAEAKIPAVPALTHTKPQWDIKHVLKAKSTLGLVETVSNTGNDVLSQAARSCRLFLDDISGKAPVKDLSD